MKCQVPGCKNLSDTQYDVDPNRPKRICSPCQAKWTPLTLDTLLKVQQADYGLEVDKRARMVVPKSELSSEVS